MTPIPFIGIAERQFGAARSRWDLARHGRDGLLVRGNLERCIKGRAARRGFFIYRRPFHWLKSRSEAPRRQASLGAAWAGWTTSPREPRTLHKGPRRKARLFHLPPPIPLVEIEERCSSPPSFAWRGMGGMDY